MKVLGISPVDKDATASLVEDGRVLFAAGEERFSRVKQHSGFPERAIAAALSATGTTPEEIDAVAYPFLTWDREAELIEECMQAEREWERGFPRTDLQAALAEAERRVPPREHAVPGLLEPNQWMRKSAPKRYFYRVAGGAPAFPG